MHPPSSCIVETSLYDIRSVESNDESIGSKISTDRSKAELYAIKYLAWFFAQLSELSSPHENALQRIERTRFTKNYRRIHKLYYRRLLPEATNDVKKEVTRVLRSRRNRENIAEEIANRLELIDDEDSTSIAKLAVQPVEREYLENWLRTVQDTDHDQVVVEPGVSR
jgi:hypothetical protein